MRTFAGDLKVLKVLLGPFDPDRSVAWHVGLGVGVASGALSAVLGAPYLSGAGLGVFLGYTIGLRSIAWIAAAVLLASAGAAARADGLFVGFLMGFLFGTTAKLTAGRSGLARVLPPVSRRASLVFVGIFAVTCASTAAMVAARKEARVLRG